MSTTQIVAWCVLAVLVFWGVGAYNRLVRLRNAISNAFGQIDVQLKRRYDLIPNLVETARKYISHERETLEAVIAARNQARTAAEHVRARPASPGTVGTLAMAEQALQGSLGRLMAVVENYPELKGDQTLRELSEELTSTENKIAFARQSFNDAALDYNDAAQQFPTTLIANLFGFKAAGMLQSTGSEAERQAVRVQF
ncbi:LemA family protein [Aquabacterium sp. A7-Y]|uniref:LemA family protein n=1 Tax=Aquabacterium sp. A7-Y TaxID=1349605 RepID=UPI00223E80E9|nr:LemA family protein [Aquabacterium sp. A7-Y]MCW7536681.1 LemA family protein [Aquabacterium sp. A7-Y]